MEIGTKNRKTPADSEKRESESLRQIPKMAAAAAF
jgi:hypothetical protein